MPILLTRDEFRARVFARDKGLCIVCRAPAADAHHILERRLFTDGGYYLNNGASVCGRCHLECEQTTIAVERLRELAGITEPVIPPHLDATERYDKWGNPVLANGQRLRGELFADESVQKILGLGGFLGVFTHWVKYPRTYHLPWSDGKTSDDRTMESLDGLRDQEIVVTEKMDGECTTFYTDHHHARSVESHTHPSRTWVANFWGKIAHDIPSGWRVCGENLYAVHSIAYRSLAAYFLGFSIWDEQNRCLSWDETCEWFALLGIHSVPVLYRGPFDERLLRGLVTDPRLGDQTQHEGYVVRLAQGFTAGRFPQAVGKYVRRNHVQTGSTWMHGNPAALNTVDRSGGIP